MTGMYKFIYTFFRGIIGLIFRLKFIGRENEPEEGALLVCSNHISAADPFLISAATNHQICYMAKKELFKIPLLGGILRSAGVFPVDRGGKDVGAVKKAIATLEKGGRVGIFPQGTRCPGKDPRDTALKNGAAMIAVKTGVDILPVFIHRKDNTPKLFRKTTVILGKPIKFSELGYDPEKSGEYARIVGVIFDEVCKLGEEFEKCQK
jgi:1-acyl-sn-glycerol-3-phosphate acyltransferase